MSKKIKHANNAKIDPTQDIVPMNLTNAGTQANMLREDGNIPLTNMQNVIDAKNFVDSNHK